MPSQITEELRVLVEAEVEKAIRDLDTLDKATGKNIDSFEDLGRALGRLAEVAALGKALDVIKDMGAFALFTADSFQIARNEFGTLLGDMEAGAGLFNQIKAFNDKTPFSLDTLTQATEVLLAAKVSLSELEPQLARFGDLSQGSSDKFVSYINAFGKASAKGKADMEVLNAYIDRGVPILDALAQQFGVTTAEIVKMTGKGKVGFEEFSAALETLTAAGGQYFGGMELGSRSLAAMQEGLQEAISSLAASFGDMFIPAATEAIEVLTAITNAINNSPLVKGTLAAALVMIAGYLSAMAVKAAIAFAAQMSLNFAVGAMNPVVLASTIAVAALAAGYVAYSAEQQKAAREAENFALEQRKQKEAIDDSSDALERYAQALKNTGDEQLRRRIEQLNTKRNVAFRIVTPAVEEEEAELQALYKILGERRSSFVDSMFDDTRAGKMQKILDQLAAARAYLADPNLGGTEESKLQEIVEKLSGELEKLANGEEGKKTWQEWFGKIARVDPDRIGALGKTAAELYLGGFDRALSAGNAASGALGKKFDLAAVLRGQQDQIQQAVSELLSIDPAGIDDPFSLMDESVKPLLARFAELGAEIRDIEYAETIEGLKRKIADLGKSENDLAREAMIANGYLPEQADAVKALMDEYDRKDILAQYQRQVDELGLSQEELARQTLVAKGATEEELAAFDKMVKLLNQPENFQELFTGWIQEGLNGLGLLDKKATEVIGNLAYQLASISFDAALEGFSEIGKALAQNKDAGDAMRDALASMSLAILDALPNLFLQAGLQLVATPGMWPLGLGLIAAAGAVSVLKGYTHGVIEQEEKAAREASKNAHGNVFGMEGLVPYARGGSFTNQIVQTPTSFRYGGSLGLMGEAGPEAIIPLKRMPSGNLGVEAGIGGSPTVVVNIMNNSGAAVNATEKTDGRGNRQIDVIIGKMIDDHLSSGRADRALTSRYDMKVKGV